MSDPTNRLDIEFDDFASAGETIITKGSTQSGVMYLTAPAKNSVEMTIIEMATLDPILEIDIEFVEPDTQLPAREVVSDPEMDKARSDLSRFYEAHRTLARSMGDDWSYQRYCQLCRDNGMVPLKLKGFTA